MKRFLIVVLLFLSMSIELQSTAHKIMVSKVRQQCLQRLEYVMRPNNAQLFQLFRLLGQQGALYNCESVDQPEVRAESPKITIIWNLKRFAKSARSTSISIVDDEDLGYDSDDDARPLFDF